MIDIGVIVDGGVRVIGNSMRIQPLKKTKKTNFLGLALALFMLMLLSVSLIAAEESRSWYADTIGIRSFVNSFGYTQIPTAYDGQGMVNNDWTTANKICELAGFKTALSKGCLENGISGRCTFTSTYDNTMGFWNPSANDFNIVSAVGRTWLASLTCIDLFECFNDNDCDDNDSYTEDNCINPGTIESKCENKEIICKRDSDCGSNGYILENYCGVDENIYQDYEEVDCVNKGTSDSYCVYWDYPVLVDVCDYGCSNKECIDVVLSECSDGIDNDGDGFVDMNDHGCDSLLDDDERDCYVDSNCGIDGSCAGGQDYCMYNDVYHDYNFFNCNNAGLNNAFCSSETFPFKIFECGNDYYGSWGGNYCKNDDVYHKQTNVDRGCLNRECFSNTFEQEGKVTDCDYGCFEGECIESTCEDNDVDEYDTCNPGEPGDDGKEIDCDDADYLVNPGAFEVCNGIDDDCDGLIDEGNVCVTECNDNIDNDNDNLIDELDPGCWDDIEDPFSYNPSLDDESRASSTCQIKIDCGEDDYVGENYCQNNDVVKDFQEFACMNPGLGTSDCTSLLTPFLINDCGEDYCDDYDRKFCKGGDVYRERTCYDTGCFSADCFSNSFEDIDKLEDCDYGCSRGECKEEKRDDETCVVPSECENSEFQRDFKDDGIYSYDLTEKETLAYDNVYPDLIENDVQQLSVSNNLDDKESSSVFGVWIFILILLIIVILIFIIVAVLFRR